MSLGPILGGLHPKQPAAGPPAATPIAQRTRRGAPAQTTSPPRPLGDPRRGLASVRTYLRTSM